MLVAQLRRESCRDSGLSPEQKKLKPTARAHGRQRGDEIHARHRLADPATLPARRPHHAGAVWKAEGRRIEHAGKLAVSLRAHHELGIDRRDEGMTALVDQLLDSRQGCAHAQAVDPHAQHTCLHDGDYRSRGVGLVSEGRTAPAVSMSTAVIVVAAIGVPRLCAKSASDSPPPTRIRVQTKRSAALWFSESSVVTAVSYPACCTAATT